MELEGEHHQRAQPRPDPRNILVGAVPLGTLLVADPAAPIASLMDGGIRRFHLYDPAEEVATAFERYDLVSAPVVDDRGKLIGRVTVDAVMDFVRDAPSNARSAPPACATEEDLFAPVLDSATEPLAVAAHQPGDGVHRLARDRRVRRARFRSWSRSRR